MEKEMFHKLASKMGITSARILCQAEEYARLAQVKCSTLGNLTATSKAVICLELAATCLRFPLEKGYAVTLSGLTRKLYQSHLKALECLLGLEGRPGLRDLGVQYGCIDAVAVAAKILERYERSLPAAQQQDLDLSKPLFTTAALHCACKCLKVKVDRKLAVAAGARKAMFDRLCVQMQRCSQDLCREAVPAKQAKTAGRKRPSWTESSVLPEEDGGVSPAPKQPRCTEEEEQQKTEQDYEEWKRQILEKALKSKSPEPCAC